jgi:hypothetical protein
MKRFYVVMFVLAFMSLSAQVSFADGFGSTVSVDTAPYMTVAGVIAVALGGIWGVKKVIKILNRS